MSVWDSDPGSDDRLSNIEVVHISAGSHSNHVHSAEFHCRHAGYKSMTYYLKSKIVTKITYCKQVQTIYQFTMFSAAFIASLVLSMFLGSAKLQLSSDTIDDKKLLENRLDNPKNFEGDLDISQAIIDAYYEQQSGENVRMIRFLKLACTVKNLLEIQIISLHTSSCSLVLQILSTILFPQTAGQCTIAAISEINILWPAATVYYAFNSSIDNATQTIVLGAIDEIENKTCL